MTIRYLTGGASQDNNVKFLGEPATLDEALRRMHRASGPHRGEGFTIFERNARPPDIEGPLKTLNEIDRRLRWRARNSRVGAVFIIRSAKDGHKYGLHKVDVHAPYHDLECTSPFIDRLWQDVRTRFPDTMDIGDYVRKQVSGLPGVWSYHAWGQAIDLRRSSIALMTTLANFGVTHHDRLHIQQVIFNRRVWEDSQNAWVGYNGVNPHTDHVHMQVYPERNLHSTPPSCFYGSN